MQRRMHYFIASAIISFSLVARADIAINGPGVYGNENFDTLSASGNVNPWVNNSTIQHWYANVTNYRASAGTDTTGAMYSFGSNAQDRALGAISSGTTPLIAIGVVMYNASSSSINLSDILISFVGEQWRQNTSSQALDASYRVQSTPFTDTTNGTWTASAALTFTAIHTGTGAALDGNLPVNRLSFNNVPVASSGALNPGEYLMVRWVKTGTSSPGLAIDDFSIRVVPEPAAGVLAAVGMALALVLRRKFTS